MSDLTGTPSRRYMPRVAVFRNPLRRSGEGVRG